MKFFKNDDDLFRESTMTFGEHLEDLRGCLFRSLLGLVLGFVVGLFIGQWVVEKIQAPLVNALTDYYQSRSVDLVKERLLQMQADGRKLPADVDHLADFVAKENLLAEEVYVNPAEVLAQLKALYPEQFTDASVPSTNDSSATNDAAASQASAKVLTKKDLVLMFLWRPAGEDPRLKAKALNVYEPFSIYLKASFLVGVILASPWVFWQIWAFVAAGLYRHERYYVRIYLPFSLGLFLAGVSLAFFFVFEPVLKFLFSFNAAMGIDPEPRISEWLSFVLFMPLGFGISFQLPLVMLFLERIGIFTIEAYMSKWKVAVLVIAFLASIFTPSPDPWSMLLMGIPLVMLYFGGVLLCRYMPRHRSPYAEAED